LTARTTASISSGGTVARYPSRPSERNSKIAGASCSQNPNLVHLPASTVTSAVWPRSRLPAASNTARLLRSAHLDTLSHSTTVLNHIAMTGYLMNQYGPTCRPDSRMCPASNVNAT
jgi:hypothetical protein